MSTRNLPFVVYPADKGLNTTTPDALMEPGELKIALNVEYDTSGSRKKRGGTTRYNTSQLTEGGNAVTFTAIADFWRHGTCLDATQKFVAHAGTTFYKDDGDGVWDAIDASVTWGTNASVTDITIAQGYAVWANGENPPYKWDQTTLSLLSSGAPNFSWSVYHLRRLFVGGFASNPSRLWYTAAGDITDFTGADTGVLDWDEDDGDRLVGVSKPWQNRLYLFKGPQQGSVHVLSGVTPTTFQKSRLFTGVPCVSHASIITTPNDIYWASRYGFHSLTATQKFGDTEHFYLSHPIQNEFRSLSDSALKYIVGFYHPTRNLIGWACPESAQNSVIFAYNYVRGLWSLWRFGGFNPRSLMVALAPTTPKRPRLYIGGYDGYVRAGDQDTKTDDNGTAYEWRIRTPVYVRLGDVPPQWEKSFYRLTSFYRPVASAGTATVKYWLDSNATVAGSASISLSQSGDLLGSTFVLGTSLLGGRASDAYHEFLIEGRGRAIQLEWEQTDASSDIEMYGHALTFAPTERMAGE